MKHTQSVPMEGKVRAYNFSPKGSYEGLLLEHAGKVTQLNFPPELAPRISEVAAVGAIVQVQAEALDHAGHATHPVYRLLAVTNADGVTVHASDEEQFSGKIMRLNYALHGEVNGAILENGDFVHMKPHGAAALKLHPGMNLTGKGPRKPTIDGHSVIEAREVNGMALEAKPKPKPKKKAAHGG